MKKSNSAADCSVDPRTPLSPNIISTDGKPWSTAELEVKDARLIFDAVWQKVTQKYGKQGLTFPKEVLWLGGAPGAGKGTNTDFILKERGITTKPIVVSALLDTPEMKSIKDMGGMVGDKEVIEILFETMLKPEYQFGCLVDGVPRTRVQAKVIEMFYTALLGLYNEYMNDEVLGPKFPRPTFRIIQLFVDEKISVERQLMRGNEGLEHNKKVLETGKGQIVEVRKTDLDPELCRKRYQTFKEQTYDALESLADLFYYQIIDASGSIAEVEMKIKDEMMYQSSLELSPLTFTSIRDIPLASEVVLHLRQKLVKSLDNAATEHLELFQRIVDEIQNSIIPVISFHAMGGRAVVHSTSELFRDKHNLSHALDILSERGYSVCTRPGFDLLPSEEAPGFKLVPVTIFDIQWQRGWHRR